jgi:hypothetical protein
MELLDRYLFAVSKHLPQARREDLIAELKDNLLSQIEDEEASLGRPLTTDEIAEVLRKHGRPLLVALQYLPQRHLIGPVMFPWYWYVLRLAVPVGMVVYLIAYMSQLLFSPGGSFAFSHLIPGLLSVAFHVAATVTLIFAVGEFVLAHYHKAELKDPGWDPRKLPRVDRDARRETPITLWADLVANVLLTLWLIALPFYPFLLLWPYESFLPQHSIHLTMMWHTMYWLLVGLQAGQTLVKLMVVLAPRLRNAGNLVSKTLGVVVLAILASAHDYFVLDKPLRPQDTLVLEQVNHALHIAFVVALTVTSIVLVLKIFRYGSRFASRRLSVAL